MVSNLYLLCWLNSRALDSGQTELQLNLACLFVFAIFSCVLLCFYCTHMVGSWFVGGKAFLLYAVVLLYHGTRIVGDGVILARDVMR